MSPTIRQQLQALAEQVAGGPVTVEATYTIYAPTMPGFEGEGDTVELALADYLYGAISRRSAECASPVTIVSVRVPAAAEVGAAPAPASAPAPQPAIRRGRPDEHIEQIKRLREAEAAAPAAGFPGNGREHHAA